MARQILGPTWMEDFVHRANDGGIERVLVQQAVWGAF